MALVDRHKHAKQTACIHSYLLLCSRDVYEFGGLSPNTTYLVLLDALGARLTVSTEIEIQSLAMNQVITRKKQKQFEIVLTDTTEEEESIQG